MVIVNPYLKKKKIPAPPLSVGAGGGIRSSSSRHINQSNNKGPIQTASRRPITSSLSVSAFNQRGSQSEPSHVTPNGKKTVVMNSSRENVASKHRVSPPSMIQKGRRIMDVSPYIRSTTTARSVHGKPCSAKKSSKSKLSVKQRLKQEITALKKQKQLQKLQKETDERRRRRLAERKAEEDRRMALLAAKEEERRQKQVERDILAALKHEEKIRNQRERERKQREKELERERKREEKACKEQEKRMRLEQQIEERRQKAEDKYRRDLQAWKKHQQRWIEQQQRIHLFQQAQQQQQTQVNYHISSEQHMPSSQQIHQYEQQQKLRSRSPLASTLPVFEAIPIQLPPKLAITQGLNEKDVSNTIGCTPETACQKTPSTPLSPLDSSTALALDTLMKSGLFSSPTKMETTDGDDSQMASIPSDIATSKSAFTEGDNKGLDLIIDNKKIEASSVDKKLSSAIKSEDSNSVEINCSLTNKIHKSEKTSTNRDSLASTNIQNVLTELKIKSPNHSVPVPTTLSNKGRLMTTVSTNTNMENVSRQLSQQPYKQLQPAHVPSSPMASLQKIDSQQHSAISVPPFFNNQYSLYSSTGYGSVFQSHTMSTQALAASSYFNPMMNTTFMNAGNFSTPGYFPWVSPPPPPPLPPIFLQPKAPHRVSSVSKRVKAPKPSVPTLLCNPMESPSPFSNQGRYLVTVMVIRDPRTESSFGVNLQLHTESALVDPQWLEAKEAKEGPKAKVNQKSDLDKNVETKHPSTNAGITTVAQLRDKQLTMPPSTPMVSQRLVAINKQSPNITSKESAKIQVSDQLGINGGVKDTEVKSEESMRKVSPANPEFVFPLTPISKIIDNPKPNHLVELKSDDGMEDIVKTCLEDLVSSVVAKAVLGSVKALTNNVQRRKRRRRVKFSVMQVMDANKQNSRRPDVDTEKKLQPGDIVVSVQDYELNGMTFKDACGVFSKKAESVSDSLIQTRVVVARSRAIVNPVKVSSDGKTNPVISTSTVSSVPTKTPIISPQLLENNSMVFSPAEIATMSNSLFQTFHSSSRVLGLDIQDSAWHFHSVIFRMGFLLKDTELTHRTSATLKNKWSHLTQLIDYNLVEKGKTFWSKTFREEFGDGKIPFSSDVERHARRHLPRPSKGCRCGKKDHEFVFDPKCTLYRDLQKRLPKDELAALRQQKKKKSSVLNKDLNMVESAFKNRIIKLKTATENESIEARFVEKMEEIQVKELHQAIFAPNLTTIVLSSIFELQREFHVSTGNDDDEKERYDAEDDDDDDDVALDCLGKRKPEDQTENDTKKQHKIGREEDPNINLKYLIRMLHYVSKTWGHCYREPERDEYAWRWELFHAVHSNYDQWDAHAKNPRVPGSFTFENVRFGLSASKATSDEVSSLPKSIRKFEDSILSNIHSTFDVSNSILDEFCMVIHLLSPARSGLYDEILALLKMKVLKISSSGIPVLTDDWWTKIDIVVLDEMHTSWSTKVDPDSRHCISEELRDTLEEKWVWKKNGWYLLESSRELMFDFAILDEWRETFEGRLEEKANLLEGIGRFGL